VSSRKTGLDIPRHQEIGLELARIRDRLTILSAEIGNAYPKDSKTARLAGRIVGPVDQLRAELDIRMFSEHPDDDAATTYVYYPQPETREGIPEDPRDFGLTAADLRLAADRLYQQGDERLEQEDLSPDEAGRYGSIRSRLRGLADAIEEFPE
jgi:hypothetical protein